MEKMISEFIENSKYFQTEDDPIVLKTVDMEEDEIDSEMNKAFEKEELIDNLRDIYRTPEYKTTEDPEIKYRIQIKTGSKKTGEHFTKTIKFSDIRKLEKEAGCFENYEGQFVHVKIDFDSFETAEEYWNVIKILNDRFKCLGEFDVSGYSNKEEIANSLGLKYSPKEEKIISIHVNFYKTIVSSRILYLWVYTGIIKEFFEDLKADLSIYRFNPSKHPATIRNNYFPKNERIRVAQCKYDWNPEEDFDSYDYVIDDVSEIEKFKKLVESGKWMPDCWKNDYLENADKRGHSTKKDHTFREQLVTVDTSREWKVVKLEEEFSELHEKAIKIAEERLKSHRKWYDGVTDYKKDVYIKWVIGFDIHGNTGTGIGQMNLYQLSCAITSKYPKDAKAIISAIMNNGKNRIHPGAERNFDRFNFEEYYEPRCYGYLVKKVKELYRDDILFKKEKEPLKYIKMNMRDPITFDEVIAKVSEGQMNNKESLILEELLMTCRTSQSSGDAFVKQKNEDGTCRLANIKIARFEVIMNKTTYKSVPEELIPKPPKFEEYKELEYDFEEYIEPELPPEPEIEEYIEPEEIEQLRKDKLKTRVGREIERIEAKIEKLLKKSKKEYETKREKTIASFEKEVESIKKKSLEDYEKRKKLYEKDLKAKNKKSLMEYKLMVKASTKRYENEIKKLSEPKTLDSLYRSNLSKFTVAGIAFNSDDESFYNYFDGWKYIPSKVLKMEKIQKYLDHVKNIVVDGDEVKYNYIMDWISFIIQNPGKKTGVMPITQGLQGTGKSTFTDVLKNLVDGYYVTSSDISEILCNFNGILEHKVLVLPEETSEFKERKNNESTQKNIITGDKILIEKKGIDKRMVTNTINIIMNTNSFNPVSIGLDSRRIFMTRSSVDKIENEAYFGELLKSFDKEFYENLMNFLVNRDVSKFIFGKAPDTAEKLASTISQLGGVEKCIVVNFRELINGIERQKLLSHHASYGYKTNTSFSGAISAYCDVIIEKGKRLFRIKEQLISKYSEIAGTYQEYEEDLEMGGEFLEEEKKENIDMSVWFERNEKLLKVGDFYYKLVLLKPEWITEEKFKEELRKKCKEQKCRDGKGRFQFYKLL